MMTLLALPRGKASALDAYSSCDYHTPTGWDLDLESQQRRVDTARMMHELLGQKTRYWAVWALLFIFVVGWLHRYYEERLLLVAELERLELRGAPIECYYDDNDANHPIPFSVQAMHWLRIRDAEHTCNVYFVALSKSRWPNAWRVTVGFFSDTVLQPLRQAIDMLAHAPMLLQILLVFGLSLACMTYLASRVTVPSLLRKRVFATHRD